MLISGREISDHFLASGIRILDHCEIPETGLCVVFGDHPDGSQILEIWDSKEIVTWFWMGNFKSCITAYNWLEAEKCEA